MFVHSGLELDVEGGQGREALAVPDESSNHRTPAGWVPPNVRDGGARQGERGRYSLLQVLWDVLIVLLGNFGRGNDVRADEVTLRRNSMGRA